MPGVPGRAWELCQLAVRKGYITPPEADNIRSSVEQMSSADEASGWMVQEGLLTDAQERDLRASLPTVLPAEPGEATDLHLRATSPAAGEVEPRRLPGIPGYRVVSEVGRGGMGVVYRAWQDAPPRWVALKVMIEGMYASERGRHRFTREIAAAAKLHHPGVVPVYEAREYDGMPYYTMEFVEGTALHEHLALEEPPLRNRLELFCELCRTVDHAHSQGLVHRDLKPSNVMIDAAGRVRVLDFGLAKFLVAPPGGDDGLELTRPGATPGTPAYMSPEQAGGDVEGVDQQSDVYSLGVILYEMLTGRLPYPAHIKRHYELALYIQREEPIRPSSVNRRLRGDLETIILTCLEKDTARRYPDAGAVAADVQRFLRIEPILARPAPWTTKVNRFLRRNRVAVASAGVAICLAAAVGLAAYASRALRQHRAFNAAVSVLGSAVDPEVAGNALDTLETREWGARKSDVLAALERALDSTDGAVRGRVWDLLASHGPSVALTRSLAVLQDPSDIRAAEAQSVAATLVSPAATQELKKLLTHVDPRVQAAAADVLHSRTLAGLVTPRDIVTWLSDAESGVRQFAAAELSRLATDHQELLASKPEIAAALLERVRTEDDGVIRTAAALALSELRTPVDLPLLSEWLPDEFDPGVAAALAQVIGSSTDQGATDLLASELSRILGEPAPVLWQPYATELVVQIGRQRRADTGAKDALLGALRVFSDVDIQLAVIEAVDRLNIARDQSGDWALALTACLSHESEAVRLAALAALGRLAAPEAVARLAERSAASSDFDLREQIFIVLAQWHERFLSTDPSSAAAARTALLTMLEGLAGQFRSSGQAVLGKNVASAAAELHRQFQPVDPDAAARVRGTVVSMLDVLEAAFADATPLLQERMFNTLEGLHTVFFEVDPAAARRIRQLLLPVLDQHKGLFSGRYLTLVVVHEWPSTSDLVRVHMELGGTDEPGGCLREVSALLVEQPEAICGAIIQSASRLTGGRIEPDASVEQASKRLHERWSWDEASGTFVQ